MLVWPVQNTASTHAACQVAPFGVVGFTAAQTPRPVWALRMYVAIPARTTPWFTRHWSHCDVRTDHGWPATKPTARGQTRLVHGSPVDGKVRPHLGGVELKRLLESAATRRQAVEQKEEKRQW